MPYRDAEQQRAWQRARYERTKPVVLAARKAYYERTRDEQLAYKRAAWRKTAEFIIAEKLRRGACLDCGLLVTQDNAVVFDFDHRDRLSKRSKVGMLASEDRLAEEMAKCDLRCANCHRLKTYREGENGPLRSDLAADEPCAAALF